MSVYIYVLGVGGGGGEGRGWKQTADGSRWPQLCWYAMLCWYTLQQAGHCIASFSLYQVISHTWWCTLYTVQQQSLMVKCCSNWFAKVCLVLHSTWVLLRCGPLNVPHPCPTLLLPSMDPIARESENLRLEILKASAVASSHEFLWLKTVDRCPLPNNLEGNTK